MTISAPSFISNETSLNDSLEFLKSIWYVFLSPFNNFFDPFSDPFDDFFDRNNEEFYEVEADAFLNLSTDKKSVYVGEGFNTTLSFFVSESNVADMRFYELGKQLTEIIKKIKPAIIASKIISIYSKL